MSDKDKIKEEIERLKHTDIAYDRSRFMLLLQIEDFINSLPEEHNEDLERELERFAYSLPHSAEGFWPEDIDPKSVDARTKYGVRHAWSYEKVMDIARHFAEWQKQKDDKHIGDLQWEAYLKGEQETKQQMMKDAVEGEYWIGEIHLDTPIIQGYDDGDRIKFIPIKTEQ